MKVSKERRTREGLEEQEVDLSAKLMNVLSYEFMDLVLGIDN